MSYLDRVAFVDQWIADEMQALDDMPDLCEQAAGLSDKLDQLMWDMQADYAAEGCFPPEVMARFIKVCRIADKANQRWERRGGGRETEEDYDQIY